MVRSGLQRQRRRLHETEQRENTRERSEAGIAETDAKFFGASTGTSCSTVGTTESRVGIAESRVGIAWTVGTAWAAGTVCSVWRGSTTGEFDRSGADAEAEAEAEAEADTGSGAGTGTGTGTEAGAGAGAGTGTEAGSEGAGTGTEGAMVPARFWRGERKGKGYVVGEEMGVEGAGEPAAGALEDLGDGLGNVDGRALAADRAEHEVIAAGGTGLGGRVHGDGRGDGRMHRDLARNVAAAGMRGVGARGLGRRVGVGGTHHGIGRVAHLVEMRPLVLHVQTGQLHRVFRRKHVGSAGRYAGRRAGRGRGGRRAGPELQ